MSKYRTRKDDYDETEHYGRHPKDRTQKRQPRNWKKVWETAGDDDDDFYARILWRKRGKIE